MVVMLDTGYLTCAGVLWTLITGGVGRLGTLLIGLRLRSRDPGDVLLKHRFEKFVTFSPGPHIARQLVGN